MMMNNPSRGKLGGSTLGTLINTTKRSNKTSERTSTTSKTDDVKSMGAVFHSMKRKYAGIKSTSKSSRTQT